MYGRTLLALALFMVTILGVKCTTEDQLEELLMRYLMNDNQPADAPTEERDVGEPEARSLSGKVETFLNKRGKVSCRKSLPEEKLCDFVGDCPDWKDEKSCKNKYRKKGGCQALIFLKDCDFCDGFTDCADNSDEENCPAGTPTCLDVIPVEWICDGWRHCYDWSDETNCEEDEAETGGATETDQAETGGETETVQEDNGVETEECTNPSADRIDNSDFDDFMQQVLDAHNYYRCLHNVGPLERSTELINHAQGVSDINAYYGVLQHSTDSNFGENLWYRGRSDSFGNTSITGLEVVKAWYDEISDYDFNNPGFSGATGKQTGHFTQVVWKETTHVGCSYSEGQDSLFNYVFVACNYDPRGNDLSEFAENVLPYQPGGATETDQEETDSATETGQEETGSETETGQDGNGGETGECTNPSADRTDNNDFDDFMQQVLNAHNYYRCLHNVGPLDKSTELISHGQSVSDKNAYYLKLEHSSDSAFGENLWYRGKSYSSFGVKYITGLEVVTAWYDEISYYDFNNPGFSGKTGHFTQVVWKETTHVGCGYSEGYDSSINYWYVFVACNYDPPGNYLSEFAENVLPLEYVEA